MAITRIFRAAVLVGAMALGGQGFARAQPPAAARQPGSTAIERQRAECARLLSELGRIHREIDAIKRSGPGLRDDYRMRQRMADAEALARNLTAAERRLADMQGAGSPPQPARAPGAMSIPLPVAGDGPLELEAKADLMADMARRLVGDANGLERRAKELRTRGELRRRAIDLDRDPFAALETSRRNMMLGPPRGRPAETAAGGNTVASAPSTPATDLSSAPPPPSPSQPRTTSAPQASGGAGATPAAPSAATAPAAPPPAEVQPAQLAPAPAATAPTTAPAPSSLPLGVRALLDPAALADVQRLERAGQPMSGAAALERAAAALRARALDLEHRARTIRGRSNP